jgi:hypothetical protein
MMKFFQSATLDPELIHARGLAAFDDAIDDLTTAANLFAEEAQSAQDQAEYFNVVAIESASKSARAQTVAARLRELVQL